ncbi:MAG: PqqD family protein [Acidobacteriota bacterium]|jgi:hypothetical protein
MATTQLPRARKDGLLITRMESGEVVVYDRSRDTVHCLNPTVADIWEACDGSRTAGEVAGLVARRHGLPAADDAVVLLGLKELETAHLLEGEGEWTGVSRRQVLNRIGLGAAAAALLPVITTVVAPTPAEAGTGLPQGASCTSGYQCLSGICIGGVCQ